MQPKQSFVKSFFASRDIITMISLTTKPQNITFYNIIRPFCFILRFILTENIAQSYFLQYIVTLRFKSPKLSFKKDHAFVCLHGFILLNSGQSFLSFYWVIDSCTFKIFKMQHFFWSISFSYLKWEIRHTI